MHIAARFNFEDCAQVLVNIGLEKSAGVDINAETRSYLTPLAVAVASNSTATAAFLAGKGAKMSIPRPKEGYRSVLDADSLVKFPWLPKMGKGPEDYTLKRVNRAIDDQAKNLGMSVELL